MTTEEDKTLDPFEQTLLAQLRAKVEQNAATATAAPASTSQRQPRRAWYATAAAASVAVLLVAILLHVVRPEPAFAVTGRNDEKITVRVMRLEGAGELEQALRERGITSDITYLPPGKSCKPERYSDRHTPGLGLEVAVDRFKITIPPGAVGPSDTFVLSASVTPLPDGLRASVDYGIATGAVGPCLVVDSP